MRLLVGLVVFGAALLAGRPVEACSCGPAGGTVCQAAAQYWRGGPVFLGRVEAIEPVRTGSRGAFVLSRRVRMRVLEPFRGIDAPAGGEVVVVTGSGGGDCGYPFRQGREYFVYASQREGTGELSVSICSGTRKAEDALTDLEYARSIAAGRGPTGRITGQVTRVTQTLNEPPTAIEPLPGIEVGLSGEQRSSVVVTDGHGVFSAEGLPPGRYSISVKAPPGHYAEVHPLSVNFPDSRACVDVSVRIYPDGRVSGRVVDASGRSLAGLTIDLTTVGAFRARSYGDDIRTVTDADGGYEFKEVPPGRYVVGLNVARREGVVAPFVVLHPGVEGLSRATVVSLASAERVSLGTLRLPEAFKYTEITGRVVNGAGEAVAGALVYLRGVGAETAYIIGEPVRTDGSGRFALTAPASRDYEVFAERPRAADDFEIESSSDPQLVRADAGSQGLTLILRARY